MLRVGLTGGIGSGKSTVATMLAGLGATVIDGDAVARDVVRPGEPALAAIVAEFGSHLLRPDGSLDRPALAAIVFPDPDRLAALNRIMHPVIGTRVAELTREAERRGEAVVVHDMPLIVERGLTGDYDLVIVVTADQEFRVRRLVERGLDEGDARARMARQATDAQSIAAAHVVISNDGAMAELAAQVERAWRAIRDQASLGRPSSGAANGVGRPGTGSGGGPSGATSSLGPSDVTTDAGPSEGTTDAGPSEATSDDGPSEATSDAGSSDETSDADVRPAH